MTKDSGTGRFTGSIPDPKSGASPPPTPPDPESDPGTGIFFIEIILLFFQTPFLFFYRTELNSNVKKYALFLLRKMGYRDQEVGDRIRFQILCNIIDAAVDLGYYLRYIEKNYIFTFKVHK
jgi:hypothetical protein